MDVLKQKMTHICSKRKPSLDTIGYSGKAATSPLMITPPRSFPEDDSRERTAERRPVLHPQPGRPLGKAQRAFNRLVASVGRLRAQLDQTTRRLDAGLIFHAQEIRPRRQRVSTLRRDVVRRLRPFLADGRLEERDRQLLRLLMVEHVARILGTTDAMDDELRGLLEELHGGPLTALEEDARQEARAEIETMFADVGLKVDLSALERGMSDEEAAAKAADLEDEVRRQTEARAERRPGHRRPPRVGREDELAKQADEARKTAIGTIYRRLAKVLHPDLEQDADVRLRKGALMQEVTAAYADHDLHTLLRLELEWIHHEEADVARLTDERLGAYNQRLREQAANLKVALAVLPFDPRYQSLPGVGPSWGTPIPFDSPVRVQTLEYMIGRLDDTLAGLQGNGLEGVLGAIEARRAEGPTPF
jgi:hypothetical protein